MDIKESLEDYLVNNISSENIQQIRKSEKVNQQMVDTLWIIVKSNKHPQAWRAAWSLFHILSYKNNFELMRMYLNEIIEILPSFKHNGQKREMMKVILLFDAKDIEMGTIIDLCFEYLFSPKEALAVRVHAMQIIYNISEIEPDLKPELKAVLEIVMQETSPALKGRGRMLLKKLNKSIKN